MTFFDHLNTLRRHLWFSVIVFLAGFGFSVYFFDFFINLLMHPLDSAAATTGGRLYMTAVYEGFLTRLKVSMITGLILSLPVHTVNFLLFLFPALTRKEKKLVSIVITAGFILIIISLYYGYRFLIPFSIGFLTGEGFMIEGTAFLLGFTKNIFYLIQFFMALVVIFQLPLLMILLISLKLVSVSSAFKNGRYVIVAAFVLSAVLTPPDVISQVMTALPLIFLYYLALLTAKILRLGVS